MKYVSLPPSSVEDFSILEFYIKNDEQGCSNIETCQLKEVTNENCGISPSLEYVRMES